MNIITSGVFYHKFVSEHPSFSINTDEYTQEKLNTYLKIRNEYKNAGLSSLLLLISEIFLVIIDLGLSFSIL